MNSEYIEVNFSDIIISTHVCEMWGLLNLQICIVQELLSVMKKNVSRDRVLYYDTWIGKKNVVFRNSNIRVFAFS